jgi:hypothetical protein
MVRVLNVARIVLVICVAFATFAICVVFAVCTGFIIGVGLVVFFRIIRIRRIDIGRFPGRVLAGGIFLIGLDVPDGGICRIAARTEDRQQYGNTQKRNKRFS